MKAKTVATARLGEALWRSRERDPPLFKKKNNQKHWGRGITRNTSQQKTLAGYYAGSNQRRHFGF
jgi:hypothetical protein